MIPNAMILDAMIMECVHHSSSQDQRSTIVTGLSLHGNNNCDIKASDLSELAFPLCPSTFTEVKVSHCLKLCHPDWSEAQGRDLQFALMEKQNPEALRPRTLACAEVKLQVPPFRYPEFPVEVGGVGELHAAFFTESRTRGRIQRSVAGNSGSLQSG